MSFRMHSLALFQFDLEYVCFFLENQMRINTDQSESEIQHFPPSSYLSKEPLNVSLRWDLRRLVPCRWPCTHTHTHTHTCWFLWFTAVVDKVHRSSTWVKVQIRIVKYYSSKSKSTAFSILLEWKYKSTQFFMYLSKKVLIDRFILQFYIDYFI